MEEKEYEQNEENNNFTSLNQFTNRNSQNCEQINIDLIKKLELIDSENIKLKEALEEYQEDLKEKDSSIEESHKIISKLKDEYSKLVKEYQNIEKINEELVQESKYSKTAINNFVKTNNEFNKLKKQNEELNNEIIKLKNENYDLKNKNQKIVNSNNKNIDEIDNYKIIINDSNIRLNNFVDMIKEREKIINEQTKKINELREIINKKDEEIKILYKFSKEINKENKHNVQEITKQAINTIKVLNHNRNHSFDPNIKINKNNKSDTKILIKNDKTTFSDFIPIFKNNKASFALKDAINSLLYIPDNIDNNIISKEFLMDMNFKTELLKSELFASLLRESKIVNFLKDLLNKMNLNGDNKLIKSSNENANNIYYLIIKMINNLKKILNENNYLKKINLALKASLNNKNLLNEKIKKDVRKNMKKIKNKINRLNNNDLEDNNYNNIGKYNRNYRD